MTRRIGSTGRFGNRPHPAEGPSTGPVAPCLGRVGRCRASIRPRRRPNAAPALALGVILAAAGCATVPGADLAGTRWQAVRIAGADTAPQVESTLAFEADSTINGSGGCNAFRGEVVFGAENALSVDRVAGTQRACPEPAMEQELRFLRALTDVDRYARENGMLVLYDADGAPVLRMRRAGRGAGA